MMLYVGPGVGILTIVIVLFVLAIIFFSFFSIGVSYLKKLKNKFIKKK